MVARNEVIKGDISALEMDALVNAANNHLWMGSGVAGALKRAGGDSIEAEAIGRGPIPVGEAVATGAGRLKARYVIHAAVMAQDLTTDSVKVAAATAASLSLAEDLRVTSIAFPALGTGVGGFPLAECARTMIDVVLRHTSAPTVIERIVFVVFDDTARRIFREELDGRVDR